MAFQKDLQNIVTDRFEEKIIVIRTNKSLIPDIFGEVVQIINSDNPRLNSPYLLLDYIGILVHNDYNGVLRLISNGKFGSYVEIKPVDADFYERFKADRQRSLDEFLHKKS